MPTTLCKLAMRLVALLLAYVALEACAAEISFHGLNDAGCEQVRSSKACISLAFKGRIEPGDAARFDAEVQREIGSLMERNVAARVGLVLFDSPGGDVSEALRIGRSIRAGVMMTVVPSGGACYSSCVLAILGGVVRSQLGQVGIHSFYSKAFLGTEEFSEASALHNRVSVEIERYLKELRIPDGLLDDMRSVPHDKLRLLSIEERKRLGIFGVDPVYLQTRRPATKQK